MRKATLGVLFLILYFGVSAAIYFASVGRTDLPLAWAYFLINLGTGVIFAIVLERVNPGLIAERFKLGPGEQHPDGSDAGCGRARCGPVPVERPGGPVAANRRAGIRISGIFVHGVGHVNQQILFLRGAVADGPRPSGRRLRALPIRTPSRLRGSYPVSCIRRPGAWLVGCDVDYWRADDRDFTVTNAAGGQDAA